jgi:hypothetical protein
VEGHLADPADVERAFRKVPGVTDSAVGVVDGVDGGNRLVAWIVWRAGLAELTTTEVRSFLSEWLPEWSIPSSVVAVEAIPRDADGRPQTGGLPDPFGVSTAGTREAGPRTPEEEVVAGVWRDVLQLDRIGVHDNFYELGGSSLLLMRVVDLIEARTGQRLDPRLLFFHSLEGVARALADGSLAQAGNA